MRYILNIFKMLRYLHHNSSLHLSSLIPLFHQFLYWLFKIICPVSGCLMVSTTWDTYVMDMGYDLLLVLLELITDLNHAKFIYHWRWYIPPFVQIVVETGCIFWKDIIWQSIPELHLICGYLCCFQRYHKTECVLPAWLGCSRFQHDNASVQKAAARCTHHESCPDVQHSGCQ